MSLPISGFRGSLNLYFQIEKEPGVFGTAHLFGNLSNFELIPAADKVDIISTMNEDYGQAADTMTDPQPTTASATINRFSLTTEALAYMGDLELLEGSEKTISDEEHKGVKSGDIIKLDGGFGVKDVSIKTGGSPLDEDQFVVKEPDLGLIEVLTDGDIEVSYTVAAPSGLKLSGGVNPSRFLRCWGVGINRFNNKKRMIKLARAGVRPGGGSSLVGTDNSEINLEFTLTTPADGSPAFEITEP